jgi:hypothetical protein
MSRSTQMPIVSFADISGFVSRYGTHYGTRKDNSAQYAIPLMAGQLCLRILTAIAEDKGERALSHAAQPRAAFPSPMLTFRWGRRPHDVQSVGNANQADRSWRLGTPPVSPVGKKPRRTFRRNRTSYLGRQYLTLRSAWLRLSRCLERGNPRNGAVWEELPEPALFC